MKAYLTGSDMSEWAEKALCIGMDTDAFFPEQGRNMDQRTKDAQKTCRKCPVRAECLTHALNQPESFGIWGGIPYRSRLKILRKYQSPITIQIAQKAIREYDCTI